MANIGATLHKHVDKKPMFAADLTGIDKSFVYVKHGLKYSRKWGKFIERDFGSAGLFFVCFFFLKKILFNFIFFSFSVNCLSQSFNCK